MEVDYYLPRSQNHHLADVRLIRIVFFLGCRNGGEWYTYRYRSMSSSSNDNVDEYPCFVSKLECRTNVKKRLEGLLVTHTITSWLALGKAAPQFNFSNKGSYHCHRISLILLHTFAKCLIALSIPIFLGFQKAYHHCIQLVTVIVSHPQNTLLRPLPDLWFSLWVKFVVYMNCEFSVDTDPATSSLDTRTRARTNVWDMTAEHSLSCLCDELTHSVDESGCLDDARQIAS